MLWSIRALGLGLFLSAHVSAEGSALVPMGTLWRHYRGTNPPSEPLTAWRSEGFDDSGWAVGASGFSTLANDPMLKEATFWPPSALVRSAFLRTRFTVEDPPSVKWLVLRLDYHDGFVAYLNGQEILRRGLTNEPVGWDEFALRHPSGVAEEFDVTAHRGLLHSGTNLLAIEVHTSATGMFGNTNSLRLVPELMANFSRGPFIQNATSNSVQIVWRTPVAANSVVEFGPDPGLGFQARDETLVTNHVVTLTHLAADRPYCYRVKSAVGDEEVVSALASFRTLKAGGDVTFLVLGDGGSGLLAQHAVAAAMAPLAADLVFHVGDIVYDSFNFGREDFRFFSVYRTQLRSVPYFFTPGNHEFLGPDADRPYLESFYLPTNDVSGTEHYYSFDHGDVHFVSLFVPTLGLPPPLLPYAMSNGSPQYCWLTNDLATTRQPWKLVFMHIPLANSGHHRFEDENANNLWDREELFQVLVPVFNRYGVQVIFSGNDHDYERLGPIGGTYQIVTGGGGGALPVDFPERDPASAQFYRVYQFVRVTVQGDVLRAEAIGTNGQVFDSFTIQRALPPAQLHRASWHTPVVETAPANDGYGNISNQTYDLIGPPLPALTGREAQLGQVRVNNDATHLYVGFDGAMLRAGQAIVLFLESPRLSGVHSLAGLGDGVAGGPEGVEALDCLENLSFSNFTPSVACVLGDEFGDGQNRHAFRPGSVLPFGQGVFRLDSGFNEVAGIRLQQFNRSPQVLEPPYQLFFPEQDADYIELALPYTELGRLQPGDVIQLAAVVVGPNFDTNGPALQLDPGFLGTALTGSGLTNAVLGAVTVRLACPDDDDCDGLENSWETGYGLDPRSDTGDNGAAGDPDHDGMTNLEECRAGTNPRDAASRLALRIEPLGPGQLRLSWDAVLGRHYELQCASNFAGGFTNHNGTGFQRTAAAPVESILDTVPTNAPPAARFYRLRVVP